MENQKRAQKHAAHGVTGFELTAYLLQNLNKYKLSPSAKLILWYLASCHNGKKGYVFPKQKTIAQKIGISERSVIRGIQELVKEGVIIIECNLSNKYFWGPRIASECPHFFGTENLSGTNDKITLLNDNLSPHVHEQKKEQKKEQTFVKKELQKVEDYKILKDYAIKRGARNLNAYINKLKQEGAAHNIIAAHNEKLAADRYAEKRIRETQEISRAPRGTGIKPTESEAILEFKRKVGLL